MLSRFFKIYAALSLIAVLATVRADAQAMFFDSATTPDVEEIPDSIRYRARTLQELDAYLDSVGYGTPVPTMNTKPLPAHFFRPSVYTHHKFRDTTSVFTPDISGKPGMRWIEEDNALARRMDEMNYNLFFNHPELVVYNIDLLPEAPKQFHAVVNPEDHTIEFQELASVATAAPTIEAHVKKRHWIRTFNASLQFSQAYVSPNWYQGGNSNINMLGNIYYNVKLNPKFHPNLLFETTAQYKLGTNSTPDDSIHSYNISDDLFQVNTTFGLKAAKRWYYSFTAEFKTQLLSSYNTNSRDLRSAFMSPGELTAGVGMTYNYATPSKKFNFDMSLAPISYNFRTCINHKMNPTQFGIEEGREIVHKFGSSAEFKVNWQITYNINLTSRLFAFTDYEEARADWENKISFEINRFLTTQVYVHARYDSATPDCEERGWKDFQVKEILSIGFAYKFSSI